MLGFESINYEENNYLFSLEFGDKIIVSDNGIKTEVTDKEKVKKYLKELVHIIDDWNNEYFNNSVISGINWSLTIRYIDGRIDSYLGHESYPSNFGALQRINNELISEVM